MAAEAVGFKFEDGGKGLLLGASDCLGGFLANQVKVVSVGYIVVHIVTESPLGQGISGGGARLAGAHGVVIILDDIDDRELPESGQVECFVKRALVDGSVAEIAEAAGLLIEIFKGEGDPGAEGSLSSDDAMT